MTTEKAMSEQAAMTVEQAIEFAREWQKGLTVYPGAMGWRVVCMVLADEVEKITAFYAAIMDERAELRNKLVAMDAENDELLSRLPDGMKHCTIVFKECEKGHGWLTATNWVQHGCPTCERDDIRASMSREIRNLAADCNKLRESGNYFKDQCTLIIGEFAGAVPLPDVLDATKGTTRDLIQYFKAAISERDELRRRVAELIHYPDCWDQICYPTIERALENIDHLYQGCTECAEKSKARIKAEAVREALLVLAAECDFKSGAIASVTGSGYWKTFSDWLEQKANQIEGGE